MIGPPGPGRGETFGPHALIRGIGGGGRGSPGLASTLARGFITVALRAQSQAAFASGAPGAIVIEPRASVLASPGGHPLPVALRPLAGTIGRSALRRTDRQPGEPR